MTPFNLSEHSHRRLNILTGEWIQVSPHRSKRPWLGHHESEPLLTLPAYDATCYLCPGNTRANGEVNPEYSSPYSFKNDFASLKLDVPDGCYSMNDLIVAKSEKGFCKVLCFSPEHNLTLPEMSLDQLVAVVAEWIQQFKEMSSEISINYVQIFENKGLMMGCSNPHPHCQIWAQESIPMEVVKKQISQKVYFEEKQRTLLRDYLEMELELQERIIIQNADFVVVVPFWATWPFESMIIPRRHMKDIAQMSSKEIANFADTIKQITTIYDNLFDCSFPYSSGIHQAPCDGKSHPEWQWHMSFYPPLLRSATVKKFMVGYEMFANPQRDITPELAASKLKECSLVHYKKRKRFVL